ncbi:MAG: nuclear transport factor 2 family protein [Planctomycetaceae bacterium]
MFLASIVRSLFPSTSTANLRLVTVAAILLMGPGLLFGDEVKSERQRPVILLTGFEPFGEERPPNPSWEGIAKLNGTDWEGFRLAAVQLPVVWGAPLEQLENKVRELKPVAVFSFGQGYPGAFAIETKALNQRGEIPDNAGNLPPLPLIVGDGPTELDSSFPFDSVARQLNRQGFSVRVSARAGQYLCEETLYSLETLRRRMATKPTVAFCHVPPLGSMLNEKPVDASTIQEFVLAFLTAWKTVQNLPVEPETKESAAATTAKPSSADESGKAAAPAAPVNPERAAVEKLVRNYFKSWSEQRMRDYADCFAENAVIQEVDDGDVRTQLKDPFVVEQTNYHRIAVFKAVEVPVQTSISFEAELARVVVYWKLTAGPRVQYGYDHFTLVKVNQDWKIVNLVFYGVKKPGN